MMIDPDANMYNNGSWPEAKSGPDAPVRHWMVGNIQGVSFNYGIRNATLYGDNLTPYLEPSPLYGSHRYAFFIFN